MSNNADLLRDWLLDVFRDWCPESERLTSTLIDRLDGADFVVIPRHPGYEPLKTALDEYLRPGSWQDIG